MVSEFAVLVPEEVRGLQERAARALPAERVERIGGWWLRHAPRSPWWVGTVLPHGATRRPGELARRVGEAERFYADRGGTARFQISPPVCPDGLDPLLAERGYRRESLVSLQVASAARVLERMPVSGESPLRVRLDGLPSPAWSEVWHAVQGHGVDPGAERELLARVEGPSAYATAMLGDEAVAVGRAVADTDWAGVFGMATLPLARGRGAARGVLSALAGWARAHDVERMYLQVERDNAPAVRLYKRAGFREVCRYHYRIAGDERRHRRSA
ncbi:GNAT family N-acetyltransferase [Streptomyces sp. F63]|uniref:GNAT family N-acetyltransferase n=1 Tax=Streptomyces sp. F63 TaxID=2824887 RepID=UPI001B38705B|nr:GNAT family N-acetyltransferase [Streptomyces sp. F63]MBQ0984085.1 GNAT family N-acetyltransferase [Streptomyces sp. F63]